LKELRAQRGWLQKDLSAATGINLGTISTWEAGRVQGLKHEDVLRLAKAFGMSAQALMGLLEPDAAVPESRGAWVDALVAARRLGQMRPAEFASQMAEARAEGADLREVAVLAALRALMLPPARAFEAVPQPGKEDSDG
jgi:transcriptional regulator with XRE-family HTH domain